MDRVGELFERLHKLYREFSELSEKRGGESPAEEEIEEVMLEIEGVTKELDELIIDEDEMEEEFERFHEEYEEWLKGSGQESGSCSPTVERIMQRPKPPCRRAGRITPHFHPWELDKTSVRQSSKPSYLPEPTSYGGIEDKETPAKLDIEGDWWFKTLQETLEESDSWTEIEKGLLKQANEGIPDIDEPTGYDSWFIMNMTINGESVKPALFEAFKEWTSEHFTPEELAQWEGRVWSRFHRWVEHLSFEQIEGIHSAWLEVQNDERVDARIFGSELLPGPDINIDQEVGVEVEMQPKIGGIEEPYLDGYLDPEDDPQG